MVSWARAFSSIVFLSELELGDRRRISNNARNCAAEGRRRMYISTRPKCALFIRSFALRRLKNGPESELPNNVQEVRHDERAPVAAVRASEDVQHSCGDEGAHRGDLTPSIAQEEAEVVRELSRRAHAPKEKCAA